MKRRERKHEANGGAVRIRNDESLAAYPLLLDAKRIEMVWVNLRYQQRHVGLHPMAAGVADHRQTRLGQVHFDLLRDIAGKTGECEVAIQSGTAGLHCQSCHGLRYRSFEHPSCGVGVLFPCGIVGCRNCGDFKPGMIGQQLDQSLSDGSGRPKDAGTQFSFHGSITLPSVSISMSSGVASTP